MNVVITGASKGIGKSCAQKFCQNSTENLILIARSKKLLKKIKEECLSLNSKIRIHLIDRDLNQLLKPDMRKQLMQVVKEVKVIDILINNAGLLINKPFLSTSSSEVQDMFDTNVLAPSALIKELIPYMGIKGTGHIVNIGSMGGFQGSSKYPGLSYYSASKAALACLSECLAVELSEKNIKVNTLCLGAVQTEMLNEAFPDYKAPVNADEMSDFIVDFAINGSKYFNGKILPVALSNP